MYDIAITSTRPIISNGIPEQWESMNCSQYSPDDRTVVAANIKLIKQSIPYKKKAKKVAWRSCILLQIQRTKRRWHYSVSSPFFSCPNILPDNNSLRTFGKIFMSMIGVTTPSNIPNSVSIPTRTSIRKNMPDHTAGKGSLLMASVKTRNAKARPCEI